MAKIAAHSEVVTYWRGIVGTLNQRGLLRQKEDGQKIVPQAVAIVTADYTVFVLDMQRLAGISREKWLDPDMWAQIRATLQGRRVFCADSSGLAIVVGRNPDAERVRLPSRLQLTDGMLPDGLYTVTLGVSARGHIVLDLAGKERAILVGGATGTGKTGTIRSLVLQVAQKCGTDKLALAIVDLKRLDFAVLANLPHLVKPVATEEIDADLLIAWCVQEMERRQAVMQGAQVTMWDKLPDGDRFPLLLLVVDEVADFADSEVMGDLVRLARKGRASGISLILATQRPDAQVLSRQVKANITTRIAFRVTDSTESRIILDRTGAESLKRTGLALTNAGGQWRKVQCTYIEDDAIGDWIDVVPTGRALSKVELSLVRYAVDKLDGAFIINKLYDAHKGQISKHALTNLGKRWEQRGWLTQPANDDAGHKVGRTVAPELISLALDAQNRDIVTGVTGRDKAPKNVTRRDKGSDNAELPPFLRDRTVTS